MADRRLAGLDREIDRAHLSNMVRRTDVTEVRTQDGNKEDMVIFA
jgi:hypothetical protein